MVVVIIGGSNGTLILASPDGLCIQWESIHTHFIRLSWLLLLCSTSCHFWRLVCACSANSLRGKFCKFGAGSHMSSMKASMLKGSWWCVFEIIRGIFLCKIDKLWSCYWLALSTLLLCCQSLGLIHARGWLGMLIVIWGNTIGMFHMVLEEVVCLCMQLDVSRVSSIL